MSLSLITAPTEPVLTLQQAKWQCKIGEDVHEEDGFLSDFIIPAAEQRAETDTNRQLLTAVYELTLQGFPCDFIDIPKPPLVSVGFIKYLDTAGVLQTWSSLNYVVTAPAGPRCGRGRIDWAYGATLPVTLDQQNAVVVRFTAGYGTPPSVPAMLKGAILLDIGMLYAHREEFVIGTIIARLPRVQEVYQSFRSYPRKRAA